MSQIKQSSYSFHKEERGITFPDHEADHCVMCGLCLPHCPTYRLTGDESESPRGRIALMRALAKDQLAPTPSLLAHLDRCLGCRACEAACPSNVPYGRLIDLGRAQVRDERPWWQRFKRDLLQRRIIPHSTILRGLGRLARLAQITGIDNLARRSGLLQALGWARLEALVPKLPPLQRWRHFYPAEGKERGQVALFKGCIASVIDQPQLFATVQLLNRLGYGVHVPKSQVCCGALARHEGGPEQALALALQNIKIFAAVEVEAIIGTASGCTASLIDYPQWAQEGQADVAAACAFTDKLQDINQFLFRTAWPAEIVLKPLEKRVVVQDPCSLRYVLHQHEVVYNLLHRIPKADILSLPNNQQCCGAAGSYMLTQPVFAQSLRSEKINALWEIRPDILVTSNIGCSLYLAAGMRERGLAVEVLHPVQLLARQANFQ